MNGAATIAGKRVLITGATGFIGRSIGEGWCNAGAIVIGVQCRGAVAPIDLPFPLHRIDADPADFAAAIDAAKPDFILHAAGSASVPGSIRDPAQDFASGPLLFQALLEGVRRSRFRPIVLFPSSAAVYGSPEKLPVEESAPSLPISPYGHHKAAAELLGREYAQCFGVPVQLLRLFSVFGERQRKLLVWELFRQFARDDEVVVQGTGNEIRDFLHIDDLAAIAAITAMEAERPFTILNVATGRGTSVREMAETMRAALGSSKTIRYANQARPGDPDRWIADVASVSRFPGVGAVIEASDLESRLALTLAAWRRSPPQD